MGINEELVWDLKEGPAEISRSFRRNLGRSWRKTSLAC